MKRAPLSPLQILYYLSMDFPVFAVRKRTRKKCGKILDQYVPSSSLYSLIREFNFYPKKTYQKIGKTND